jgi:hypothetical protein
MGETDAQKNRKPVVLSEKVLIPVYLIDDDKIGTGENVFVPEGEKCVFINCRKIPDILMILELGKKQESKSIHLLRFLWYSP